jgi:hypothetical protein
MAACWFHRFQRELAQHESRSAAELEALKSAHACADDDLGRQVESLMGRQAQLRGDVRAQQELMRSNKAAVGHLQSEAGFCTCAVCCCPMRWGMP